MNKKAQAYGISWFFATIVIFFILVLFVVASALLGLSNKNAVTLDSLKNFNNVKNLNEFDIFYEYGQNITVGNLSYNLDSGEVNEKIKNYFLLYSKEMHNLSTQKGSVNNGCLVLLFKGTGIFEFYTGELSESLPSANEKIINAQFNTPVFSNLNKLKSEIYLENNKNYFPISIMSEGC